MQLLNATTILRTLSKARKAYKKGTLSHEVAKITVRDFWLETDRQIDINKKQLIEMAKNGEDKPIQKKHPLGFAFSSYVSKSHKCYDVIFIQQIKKYAPHWIVRSSQNKKEKLLKLAAQGKSRPNSKKEVIGRNLTNYTSTLSSVYDPIFTQKIKSIAPHWFTNRTDIANQKKKTLIQIAKNGEKRPNSRKHPLGNNLHRYTKQSSKYYDPIFTNKIKSIAPHWFIPRSNNADNNKKQLIQMAKNKEPRPSNRIDDLGKALNRYTTKSSTSYDPIFTKKIKSLTPHWFRK
jgi:hypothetical protein